MLSVGWSKLSDFTPEISPMIFLCCMGKLMNHNIVKHHKRCHDKPPVKLEPIIMGAGPPFGLGIREKNIVIRCLHSCTVFCNSFCNYFFCLRNKPLLQFFLHPKEQCFWKKKFGLINVYSCAVIKSESSRNSHK